MTVTVSCIAASDFSEEEEQTYDEVVDMGNRNPNSQGTGDGNCRREETGLQYMTLEAMKVKGQKTSLA